MTLLPDLAAFDAQGKPGDWTFLTGKDDSAGHPRRYIGIRLTDAGDGVCIIPIVTQGDFAHPERARTDWYWDGNREAPTLTPSILHHSTPPWHGYLTAGNLVTV